MFEKMRRENVMNSIVVKWETVFCQVKNVVHAWGRNIIKAYKSFPLGTSATEINF